MWWAPMLAGACATPARPVVSDEQLSRVPQAERRALLDRETEVRVAESNMAAARTAQRDAERFRGIVKREVDAATSSVRAARSGVELGQTTRDENLAAASRRELRLGEAQLRTVRSKRTYADRLVDYRGALVALREAQVNLARAEQELDEFDALSRHGEAKSGDRGGFVRAVESARASLGEARDDVRKRKAAVDDARGRWYARREELESVRADVTRGNMTPPPAPTPVPSDE
jgi:hypothetical protein